MDKRSFSSIEEHYETCRPRNVLSRLEKTLCSKLGLTKCHQHRLSLDDDNPRKGFLEVARRPYHRVCSIEELIKSFYKKRGFTVAQDEELGAMSVKIGDEQYTVSVTASDSSYSIRVR